MINAGPQPKPDPDLEQFARDMIEASRTIEMLAAQMADQIETAMFAYAKQIRERAALYLPETPERANDAD